ncbi:MAG: hypothetical protein NVSMB65_10970 [Chloroflexota bacterium]
MVGERAMERADNPLTRPRARADYNAAEQGFSLALQEQLQKLLEGKSNYLALLRRYPAEPGRLGVMATPPGLRREDLRLGTVEELVWEGINFVRMDSAGGPVSQATTPEGDTIEFQTFATRYPHIVIERTDRFAGEGGDAVEITWGLRRVQNQRAQTQINRLLDAANLAFELLRVVR